MMITTLALALQVASPLASQKWKIDFGFVGEIHSPVDQLNVKDPVVYGEFSVQNIKTESTKAEDYLLTLKFKKTQSPLVEALSAGIADSPLASKGEKDKDFAFVIDSYRLNLADLAITHHDAPAKGATVLTEDGRPYEPSYQSQQILNPLAIGVAIMRRAMTAPELKKEYFLMDDGSRRYFAVYTFNPNATLNEAIGEAAYRVNVVMKEAEKKYPKFFQGAIRVNTKSKTVEYLRATSSPADGPQVPQGDSPYENIKSFMINMVAK